MNRISFKVVSSSEWFGDVVAIEIDGMSLIDLVREIEMPMATNEGAPNIAGAYMGIAAMNHLPPSQHFLGVHDRPVRDDAKTDVLWCRDCGEPGCWPLNVSISTDGDIVTWSEFEQPHRRGTNGNPPWVYDEFGPFVFRIKQYRDALEAASHNRYRRGN